MNRKDLLREVTALERVSRHSKLYIFVEEEADDISSTFMS